MDSQYNIGLKDVVFQILVASYRVKGRGVDTFDTAFNKILDAIGDISDETASVLN